MRLTEGNDHDRHAPGDHLDRRSSGKLTSFSARRSRVRVPHGLRTYLGWVLVHRAALQAALADGGPCFVDIVTESQITETPPVHAWLAAEAARRG